MDLNIIGLNYKLNYDLPEEKLYDLLKKFEQLQMAKEEASSKKKAK